MPRWRAGIDALGPAVRDIFLVGLYTGMRRGEVCALRWERVDLARRILRVEETKTGEPLELPVTRQLAAIFERRRADGDTLPLRKLRLSCAGAGRLSDQTVSIRLRMVDSVSTCFLDNLSHSADTQPAQSK